MEEKWVLQIKVTKTNTNRERNSWVTIGDLSDPISALQRADEYNSQTEGIYRVQLMSPEYDAEIKRVGEEYYGQTRIIETKLREFLAKKTLEELIARRQLRWESEGETKPGTPDWQIYVLCTDGEVKWIDAYLKYEDSIYKVSVLRFLKEWHHIDYEKNWEKAVDKGLKIGIIRSRIPVEKEGLEEYTKKKKTKEQVFDEAVTAAEAGSKYRTQIVLDENKIYPITEGGDREAALDAQFMKDGLSYDPGKDIKFIRESALQGINPIGNSFNILDFVAAVLPPLAGVMYGISSWGALSASSKLRFDMDKLIKEVDKQRLDILKPLPFLSNKELEYLSNDIEKLHAIMCEYTHYEQGIAALGMIPVAGSFWLAGMGAVESYEAEYWNNGGVKNTGTTLSGDPDWSLTEQVLMLGSVLQEAEMVPLAGTVIGLALIALEYGVHKWTSGYLSAMKKAVDSYRDTAQKQEAAGIDPGVKQAAWDEATFAIEAWRNYNLLVDTIFEDIYVNKRDVEIRNLKQPYQEFHPADPYSAVLMVNQELYSRSLYKPIEHKKEEDWIDEDTYIDKILKPYLLAPLQILEIYRAGQFYRPAFAESLEEYQNRGSSPSIPSQPLEIHDEYIMNETVNNEAVAGVGFGGVNMSTVGSMLSLTMYGALPQQEKAQTGLATIRPSGWDGAAAPSGYFLGGLKQLVAGQERPRGGFSPALDLPAYLLAPFKKLLAPKAPSVPGGKSSRFSELLFQIPQMLLTSISPAGPLIGAGQLAGDIFGGRPGGQQPQMPAPQIVHRFEKGAVQIHNQSIDKAKLGNLFVSFLKNYSRK